MSAPEAQYDEQQPQRGEQYMTEHGLTPKGGRVSDVDFGLAALYDLVSVTAGAKPRNDLLSLSFSRRPQHGM
jgi:hypothetical protein